MTKPMNKIIIIGPGGAGKSTLARKLGELLALEPTHLDALYWKSGWAPTPRSTWRTIQENLVARPRWIIDGNYDSTLDLRLAAADTVIFLDMPRALCLWRVMRRRIEYHGRCRPDLTPGCPERLDLEFLRWIWDYPRTARPAVLSMLAACRGEKTILHLKTPRQVKRFLRALERNDVSLGARQPWPARS